jgi:uncharacterized oligopeptide transporter (OPT) family protein
MISVRAILVGSLLGIVFAGAATYAGHKVAIVDAGNIPAAILAFGILSVGLKRRPSVHDGNIVQTVSSSAAMMAISGGTIGPVAALWIAGRSPNVGLVIVWGIAVAVVGCLMAVPLRTAFITRGTLPFPSGAATAEVLDAIYSGTRSASHHLRLLAIGGGTAVVFSFARSLLGWIPEMWAVPVTIGMVPASAIYLGIGWSPLLASLGYLAGARVAISLVVGAVIAWVVIAPQLVAAGISKPDYYVQVNWLLWSGTGLMVGGTIGGIVHGLRNLRASLRDLSGADGLRMTRAHALQLAIAAGAVIVFGTVAFDVHPLIPAFGLVLSVVFCSAAARAIGETDNTPAGPLGGFAQVVIGSASPGGIDGPLTGGGVVNGALMHSAMMLQNWKTGALVKTPPASQLVAQLAGVVVGAVVCAAASILIVTAYGLGTEAMPAPAAMSWKATADIVKNGISAMPTYAPLGAAIALVVGIVLSLKPVAKYAPSPVAMGMAFILPPYVSFTMAIGGFVYWLVARRSKAIADESGVALASGMIAGEAIAGLVIAILIVAGVHA